MNRFRRMPDSNQPLCMTGPYGPAVLACGHLHSGQRGKDLQLLPAYDRSKGQIATLHYRFISIDSGAALLCLQGHGDLRLPEGSVALLTPGMRGAIGFGGPCQITHLLFDLGGPRRWHRGHPMGGEASPGTRLAWGCELGPAIPGRLHASLRMRMRRIRLEYWYGLTAWLQANAWLSGMIAAVLQEQSALKGFCDVGILPKDGTRLGQARSIASRALASGRSPSVAEMAAEAGLSIRQFHRAFTACYGESPSRWIDNQRMDRAAVLVAHGEPVARVARSIGYRSAAAFIRAFRRRHGVTPGHWDKLGESI